MDALNKPWGVVHPNNIDAIWPQIEPGLASAIATSMGEETTADVLRMIKDDTAGLFIFRNGESVMHAVVLVYQYSQYNVARVPFMWGHGISGVLDLLGEAEQWGREHNCKYIEGWAATESRARLFNKLGFKPVYTTLRKPL